MEDTKAWVHSFMSQLRNATSSNQPSFPEVRSVGLCAVFLESILFVAHIDDIAHFEALFASLKCSRRLQKWDHYEYFNRYPCGPGFPVLCRRLRNSSSKAGTYIHLKILKA